MPDCLPDIAERWRGEARNEGLEPAGGPVEDSEQPSEAARRANLSIVRTCLVGEDLPLNWLTRSINRGHDTSISCTVQENVGAKSLHFACECPYVPFAGSDC